MPKEKRVSDEVAERLREHATKGSKGITPLLNQAADLLQATPPDGLKRFDCETVTKGHGYLSSDYGEMVAYPGEGEWVRFSDVQNLLASTQPSDGRVRVELTEALEEAVDNATELEDLAAAIRPGGPSPDAEAVADSLERIAANLTKQGAALTPDLLEGRE